MGVVNSWLFYEVPEVKKNILVCTSVALLGALVLTGCNAKLSAEETCGRLVSSGQEMDISAAIEDLNQSVENSDPVGAKMSLEAVEGWLLQVAEETGDKDFRESLTSRANFFGTAVDIQLDSTLDALEKYQKALALPSSEHQELYLRTNCLQVAEFFG